MGLQSSGSGRLTTLKKKQALLEKNKKQLSVQLCGTILSVLRIGCTVISEVGETSQGFMEKWWFPLGLRRDLLAL